ncbi:MAG: acyloxyacyl hydrolase [Betaproteobacteria bacterium]|nr:acyloxyacyl hydrolase [Betaproteobacteria bacterium]PIW70692.1 MAG: acyloxyacyl hydrolase [Hydrogenophilales bacterium CG12_big_fil_rev_8_21_14_0_65_61_21]
MRPVALALLLAGLTAAIPCFAIDGYFADTGGADGIQSVKLGMIRHWNRQWLHRDNWHLTGYWEAALAYLRSDGPNGAGAVDVGLTPVFRLRPDASGGVQPYLDAAIGLHLVSKSRLDDRHNLGCALQFGPLFGLGVTFGDKSQYDLGYRFQHLSNAGIAQPNDGISLHEVRLTYLY